MTDYRILLGLAALLGACASHAADPKVASANPAFANPDTPGLLDGKPAPDVANVTDMVFLKQLAIGNKAEVDFGKLAVDRNAAPGVETFAQRMIKDHDRANSKLAGLARSARVELPRDLDAEHAAVRGDLSGLRGSDFDLQYVEAQIKDHQKAAQLLIYEIGQGQHAGVRQFAQETLPDVMQHLQMAKSLHAQLTNPADAPARPVAASH